MKKALGKRHRATRILLATLAVWILATSVRAAELPTIEIGLPDDGLFGLDRKSTRLNSSHRT